MKEITRFLTRIPKWIYITLSILLVLTLIISILANYRLKPFVSDKLKVAVTESTNGLYTLDFTDLHINLLRGRLGFDSLSLRPDTAILAKMRLQNEAPGHVYQLNIKGLAFRNISFLDIYLNKELDMGSIVVAKPEVIITYNDFNTKEAENSKKTAYQRISKFLKSLHVSSILLDDADVSYTDKSQQKPHTTRVKGLDIEIVGLLIDSASQSDQSKFYYTEDIRMNLKDHQFITKDSLYTISIGDLSASTSGKNLRATDFKVKPNLPEIEFSRKYNVQHDRYDLDFREIILHNIDFLRLNTQRKLTASALIINKADVYIFMNRELPPVSFDKGRNYPHVAIRRLPLSTSIDSLLINDSRIRYSEFNPKSQKKGMVSFDRFNAVIKNVSNDSLKLAKDPWAKAQVSTRLMNKGQMNVNLDMNQAAADARFNFNGSLGSMDMRELNSLSRNMSLAEIESGAIQKAEFNVNANWRNSSGYFRIYYNNLKINILKKDEDSNGLQKRGLLSTLANTLIIKDDNPGKDGVLRTGEASAERLDSGSFFNLMWKSVFEGLKESVGFTLGNSDRQKTRKR